MISFRVKSIEKPQQNRYNGFRCRGEHDMIIHLNSTNFKSEVLKSDLPVLVDFWADWCGPCHRLTPILEDLAREVEGKAKIAKLDVDAEEAIADEYRIMSMPTLVVFDKGEIKDTMIGLKSKDALKSALGL